MEDGALAVEPTLALLDEMSFSEGTIIAESAMICEDADVNSDVLLLNEDSSVINFNCAAPQRYLVLFLKSLDSFVSLEVRYAALRRCGVSAARAISSVRSD